MAAYRARCQHVHAGDVETVVYGSRHGAGAARAVGGVLMRRRVRKMKDVLVLMVLAVIVLVTVWGLLHSNSGTCAQTYVRPGTPGYCPYMTNP